MTFEFMTSFITYPILSLLVFFVLSQRRVASTSASSLQLLKVRVIPAKSAPAVELRPVAKPLPEPEPCISPVVVGAQQLSLHDAFSDVDDLISSFSNLSLKAPLRSCLKRGPCSSDHRRVHFPTVPGHSHIDVCELRQFEISPPAKPLRKGPFHHSCTPHIFGHKDKRLHRDGRVDFIKAVGFFEAPQDPLALRPRCKNLREHGSCKLCLRRPTERNTWHLATECNTFHLTKAPTPRTSTKLTYFT